MAGACFAAGVVSFELISFDLSARGVSRELIPLFLALATAVGSVASFGLGTLYDRGGMPVILDAVALRAMFSPFVFLLSLELALVGMVLWGIGQSTQDMLQAVVAGVLPTGRRNLAFGLYSVGHGSGWLLGAVVAGILYGQSRVELVAFAAGIQVISLPFFILARRRA